MLLGYIRPTIDGTDMRVKKHAECHGNDFSILMSMELRSSHQKTTDFMPPFRGSFLSEARTAARVAMTVDGLHFLEGRAEMHEVRGEKKHLQIWNL